MEELSSAMTRVCEDAIVTYFRTLFQNSPGGTEENEEMFIQCSLLSGLNSDRFPTEYK
jgi:hypothetical protein